MDVFPLIAGGALLVIGAAFALTIGLVSSKNDEEREHQAGS
jgi:hypothetical protein